MSPTKDRSERKCGFPPTMSDVLLFERKDISKTVSISTGVLHTVEAQYIYFDQITIDCYSTDLHVFSLGNRIML